MDSILASVKSILGIPAGDDFFNDTILMHINAVFSILRQLGVGDSDGFIADETSTWTDFFGEDFDPKKLQLVKTYMGMKVRSLFDPPASGTVSNSLDRMIAELEWRINVQVDPSMVEDDDSVTIYVDNLDDDEF